MATATLDIRNVEIIVASLKRRHTGVTSTIVALLPIQAKSQKIAALGVSLPADWPQTSWASFFRHGWRPPKGRAFRIWHARRNNEMLAGVFFRYILRMPLKLVFTSAALRDHTRWTRFLLRRMDRVIATSPEAASHLRVPSTTIMHGVDPEQFHPTANREEEWKQTGLPGRFGIGVFGRVRAQKGTDVFVEAMCRLLPQHPDFTAVVVGLVTPEQKSFSDKLKSRAADAGQTNRIRFLGELPPDEVRQWMRRMTIVVCPQRWEGFGLVPIEAMSSGAAVVATRAGAAHHLVLEEKTGHLVPPGKPDIITEKIETLMKNPARAAEMGQQGRLFVLERFSVQREAAEIQGVYEQCRGCTQ